MAIHHTDFQAVPEQAGLAVWSLRRDPHDMARWIEATHRPFETPSHVDLAKRDGLLADLTLRLCR